MARTRQIRQRPNMLAWNQLVASQSVRFLNRFSWGPAPESPDMPERRAKTAELFKFIDTAARGQCQSGCKAAVVGQIEIQVLLRKRLMPKADKQVDRSV